MLKWNHFQEDDFKTQKGLFNFCPACIVDGDFLLSNEIYSYFQQMLDLGFSETSKTNV